MIRDMEQVVSRRETIVTRGEAQGKIDKKTPTKGAFQKKLMELKKKIKNTQKVLQLLYLIIKLFGPSKVGLFSGCQFLR